MRAPVLAALALCGVLADASAQRGETPVRPRREAPPTPTATPAPPAEPAPSPPTAPAAVNPTPSAAPALQRSVSVSKQFVVYNGDGTIRARVLRKVEDLKTQWLQMLQLEDEWKSPIIIKLIPLARPGTPRLTTNLFLADGQETKVQMDVGDLRILRTEDFDREVFRALCLELMYRDQAPKEGKPYQNPPAWLVDAFAEDALARKGEGIAAGLYDRIVESGPPPKLDAFLKEKPELMDATTRAIFRARAMALLRALLATPGGGPGMVQWMRELPGINASDDRRLLANFPSLAADPSALSKQWALMLADASAVNRAKPLSMDESARELTRILDVGAPKDPKKPNDDLVSGPQAFPYIARTKTGKFIMVRKAEELLRLQIRAHPLLKPVVEEYHLIATELAAKPKKNVESRLTKNEELQKAIVTRSGEIADYLNWFEAAKLETPSQEFDVILEMPEDVSVRRGDTVTRHLNDLEARGW